MRDGTCVFDALVGVFGQFAQYPPTATLGWLAATFPQIMIVQNPYTLLTLQKYTKPVILARNGHCYLCFKADTTRHSYQCWEYNRYLRLGYDMSDEEFNLVQLLRYGLTNLGE